MRPPGSRPDSGPVRAYMTQQPPPNWSGTQYPGQYPHPDTHNGPRYDGSPGYPGYPPPAPAPRPRKRWPWYVGGAAVIAVGALTVVLVLQGGSGAAADRPSLRESLVSESSFPDGFAADTQVVQDAPADSGIGISLDVGDSDYDPSECADLLNTETSLGADTMDVAQVSAQGDEPTGLSYTQAVMQLPDPATELASLDPLREAIDSCGAVELSGIVNGEVNLRDMGLPAAGDDSLALSFVVETDTFDMVLALAAVMYDDRIMVIGGVTTEQDLDDVDEIDAQMNDAITDLYTDALEQAGV